MLVHGYRSGMDLAMWDILGMAIAPKQYRHRTGFYSNRFVHGCTLLDNATCGVIKRFSMPKGNESYQWAILQPTD